MQAIFFRTGLLKMASALYGMMLIIIGVSLHLVLGLSEKAEKCLFNLTFQLFLCVGGVAFVSYFYIEYLWHKLASTLRTKKKYGGFYLKIGAVCKKNVFDFFGVF